MGKKYIVELKKNETLYKAATRESDGTAYVCSAIGTPYTEPDMEQVRKEAYDKGYDDATAEIGSDEQAIAEKAYQKGLSDAWEAARKIGSNSMCSLEEMGFDFGQCVFNDYNPSWYVVKNYSASECIEKIRQYEQEKEEIQVGDEVIYNGTTRCVVYSPENDKRYASIIDVDGVNYSADHRELTKTGRHFPEIAAVLEKMKES